VYFAISRKSGTRVLAHFVADHGTGSAGNGFRIIRHRIGRPVWTCPALFRRWRREPGAKDRRIPLHRTRDNIIVTRGLSRLGRKRGCAPTYKCLESSALSSATSDITISRPPHARCPSRTSRTTDGCPAGPEFAQLRASSRLHALFEIAQNAIRLEVNASWSRRKAASAASRCENGCGYAELWQVRKYLSQPSTSIGGWPVSGKTHASCLPRRKVVRPLMVNCRSRVAKSRRPS